MRYREVLDTLALLADNPGILPSFAVPEGGVATVTDMAQVESMTLWDRAIKGFSKETLALLGRHNPDEQWTLDAVVSAPHLEALHYACLWALSGPPPPDSPAMALLSAPRLGDVSGFHFDVACQLAAIPPGWLHFGSRRDVPRNACYKANHRDKYLWVTPDGMEGLSEFTLVLLDIATVDPGSLVPQQPMATVDLEIAGFGGDPKKTLTVTETRPVRRDASGTIIISDRSLRSPPEIKVGKVEKVTPPLTPRLWEPSMLLPVSK
jgi:hypothetical protein